MTREHAKKILTHLRNGKSDLMLMDALDMAISALSEELSEDGTLTVHVSDGSKVNRVFVMGDNIFGGLYYPDSAENKGEWIESKERSGHWYCSVCGGIRNDPESGIWREVHDYKPFFCPNCGADMRGNANE